MSGRDTKKDMYLEHQFTDRQGKDVFNILDSKPEITHLPSNLKSYAVMPAPMILGQMRILPDTDVTDKVVWIDWASNDEVEL